MSYDNRGYSRAQILLHWSIALLVLGVFFTPEGFLAAQEALRHGRGLRVENRCVAEDAEIVGCASSLEACGLEPH